MTAAMWIGGGGTSHVPRMLAVVRFPSLYEAVRSGREQPLPSEYPDRVEALSISDPQSTAAAAWAVRHSGGDVLVVDDHDLTKAWTDAAAHGWLLELSSAAATAGATELRRRGHEGSRRRLGHGGGVTPRGESKDARMTTAAMALTPLGITQVTYRCSIPQVVLNRQRLAEITSTEGDEPPQLGRQGC